MKKGTEEKAGKDEQGIPTWHEGERGRSRKRRQPKKKGVLPVLGRVLLVTAVSAVVGAGAFYIFQVQKYKTVFLPNTTVNGFDVSGLNLQEAMDKIETGVADYKLTLVERGGEREEIAGSEIGLSVRFGSGLSELLMRQDTWKWPAFLHEPVFGEIETSVVFDESLLDARLWELRALDEENWQEPESARISGYDAQTKGYSVVPAWPGTEIIAQNVKQAVAAAVPELKTEIDLDAEGCYMRAAVTEVDASLTAAVEELNRYTGAVINYTFGDETETLDGDTIHEWLSVDGTVVTLDEELAAAYVKGLSERYNTAGKEKKLMTSYGEEVTITRGNYGWKINEKKETEALLAAVRAGETQTREPEYSQRAAVYGEKDYGDTYVELNLTTQHLFFYKDGELIVETDFVSGNEARGMATPAGAYFLFGHRRNAVLVGRDYRTPVSYWMPFNGGIGLHDANWRGRFGGTIYKRNGSHGCVNLPTKAARTIYDNITIGDPVLCYHLDPAKPAEVTVAVKETKASPTKAAAKNPAPAPTPAPTPAPENPAPTETLPADQETQAPVGPSVTEETPANPAEESAAASSEGTGETLPVGPSVPAETEPTTPPITAGGDEESFGPGFMDIPQETTQEIGPGM
ncbi:MAG: L,D-transpeptidase family protein [Lachnospiraceae bacterium]|nr:L,D-transpeptidase family protein [Lachnospiraceae bacterium]